MGSCGLESHSPGRSGVLPAYNPPDTGAGYYPKSRWTEVARARSSACRDNDRNTKGGESSAHLHEFRANRPATNVVIQLYAAVPFGRLLLLTVRNNPWATDSYGAARGPLPLQ